MTQRAVEGNQKRTLPPQEEPPRSPRESLPTMYDLPSEEVGERGLPDEFHLFQSQLLRETFQPINYSADEVFIGTDINLYFDIRHTSWYKRPDWFASVGVPRLYDGKDLRLSYLVWQEGINPLVVVELLSPSTEKEDLGQATSNRSINESPSKWEVYQTILRVPFYFTYDHLTQQIRAFRLEGDSYIAFLPNKDGRFSLPSISLCLGLWGGSYQNINETWLRWFDGQGNLILTPLEKEAQEKENLLHKAERLAAKLKELGIDPEQI